MAIQIEDTQSRASIGGHPIHPMLVPFPIAFLIGGFASDLVFWSSGDPFWGARCFCGWLAPAWSWAPWPPFSD
jgi:uncharacterized membrane protein